MVIMVKSVQWIFTDFGQFAGDVDPVSDREVVPGINDLSLAVDDPEAVFGGLIANPDITALLHPVRDLAAVLSVPNPALKFRLCHCGDPVDGCGAGSAPERCHKLQPRVFQGSWCVPRVVTSALPVDHSTDAVSLDRLAARLPPIASTAERPRHNTRETLVDVDRAGDTGDVLDRYS